MKHYLEFLTLQISLDKDAPNYFEKHKEEIMRVVDLMHKKFPIKKEATLYRGLWLSPPEFKRGYCLTASYNVCSFTEDLDTAYVYANDKDLAKDLLINEPDLEGALITLKDYEESDVIFHYTWTNALGLDMFFSKNIIELITQEREVLVIQKKQYPVKRVKNERLLTSQSTK